MNRVPPTPRPPAGIAVALAVGAIIVGALAVGVLALTTRVGPGAPAEPGVCWRVGPGRGGPAFVIVAKDVVSLDDCAAVLEAIHVQGALRADGAFQGYFIFVDAKEITSSTGLRGFRYPIFQPAQRREVDADLRGLIEERHGRLPTAGDIAVERK
ncbi:MAG: hypothetical protein ACR2F8_11280 [Caulobacteraceae bacterium]